MEISPKLERMPTLCSSASLPAETTISKWRVVATIRQLLQLPTGGTSVFGGLRAIASLWPQSLSNQNINDNMNYRWQLTGKLELVSCPGGCFISSSHLVRKPPNYLLTCHKFPRLSLDSVNGYHHTNSSFFFSFFFVWKTAFSSCILAIFLWGYTI